MVGPSLASWLREEPFTLMMSSGFFGFFAHAGVMTALEDAGTLPARISGASAGALVGGGWAAGIDGKRFAEILFELRREDFWDPRPGLGVLRGALFRARLDAMLPVRTFEACRVPLAISTYDVLGRRARAVVEGELAPVIHASCAVPFMFHPVWIDGRPYLDGGVADRPGLLGLPKTGRVLFHHLASRSPWRRRGSPALSVPARDGMTTLVVEGLPRVGPFTLEEGRRAFEIARGAAARALSRPLSGGGSQVVLAR